MGAVDDLAAAVNGSTKIDAGTKEVIAGFLRDGGGGGGVLGADALQEVIRQLAGNDRAAAIETLAESFSEEQVAALLESTQAEMDKEAAGRESRIEAGQAVMGALESAALSVMMQAIISAL